MRRAASIVFVVTGLWLWFGPWQAAVPLDGSAGSPGASGTTEVACAWAPVDLMLYSSDPLGSDGWFGGDSTAVVPAAAEACRTSAWWRTIIGVLALGIGLGAATRDRTHARIARIDAAEAERLRPLGT